MKRIVIIGATSAIAEHCIRHWIHAQPTDLTLVGRSEERLQRVADDLQVRSAESTIRTMQSDFLDADGIEYTVKQIGEQGRVDIVLIAHGTLPDQADCQNDLNTCRQALDINATSPVLFAEAFANQMAAHDHGTIALISSVAGDRGRKSNYTYGAAKGLVTSYAQGLQHRFAESGVAIVLVKPGPTATPMTAHMADQRSNMTPVDDAARQITRAVAKKKHLIYVPGKWAVIMFVIRRLPSYVFNKLDI